MPRAENAFGYQSLHPSINHARFHAYQQWKATPEGQLDQFLYTLKMEHVKLAALGMPRKPEKVQPVTSPQA